MGENNRRLVLIVHLSAIAHSMFTVTFTLLLRNAYSLFTVAFTLMFYMLFYGEFRESVW